MSRRPRRARPALVAATVLSAALALGGCSAGSVTQTDTTVSSQTGSEGQVGEMLLRSVTIDPGTQTVVPAGATVALAGTLVNEAATGDRLVSVSTPYAASVRAEGQFAVAGDNAVRIIGAEPGPVGAPNQDAQNRPDPDVRNAGTMRILLVGATQVLHDGPTYPVTFTFERAGTVTVPVPMLSRGPVPAS